MVITRDGVEQAYCFFHQKHRVYIHSRDERQREDIEWAVEQYASQMSAALREAISTHEGFLGDPTCFLDDLEAALTALERILQKEFG